MPIGQSKENTKNRYGLGFWQTFFCCGFWQFCLVFFVVAFCGGGVSCSCRESGCGGVRVARLTCGCHQLHVPATSHQCHQPGRNCHQPTSHNTAAREKTTKATQILAGFSDPSLFGWCPCLNCLWLPFQIAFDPYRAFYPESPWLPATIRLSFSTVIIESEPLLQTKVNETAAENWQT